MTDKEFGKKIEETLQEALFESNEKMEDEPVTETEMEQLSEMWDEELANIHGGDPVNHPKHYGGRFETIDVIRDILDPETDAQMGYYIGNVIKYLSRYRKKGEPKTDLEKAGVYLTWAIERLKELGE